MREVFHALGYAAILSARPWSWSCIAPPAILDVHLEFTILALEILVHNLKIEKGRRFTHPAESMETTALPVGPDTP